MKVRKVLVFPAGTEVGLEIHEALRLCKEIMLFGAGVASSSHAPFAFERFHAMPSIREHGWLESLIRLCQQLEIDYIFPAYDDVVVALAQHRGDIPAVVLTADLQTCLITRSKSSTYAALRTKIRVPKVYSNPQPSDFPLLVKPDQGQGSQGVARVCNNTELHAATAALTDPIVCEYLPGEEFTVDCLSDRERGVLFASARVRKRMRNGIAVNTEPVVLNEVEAMAEEIHSTLQMRGAWFFQLKRSNEDELVLLEVAPRIAGSMSTHRVQGVNFPLLTIYEYERIFIRPLVNPHPIELDRALRNRFTHNFLYSTLYIDLDDTLILRREVNLDAVQLIYQCINRGITVKLITRHSGDLDNTLTQYRLQGLFDEVIHLTASELKSKHIKESDALFLDDSFSERLEVSQNCGIPTFDCSMIELLLNQTR